MSGIGADIVHGALGAIWDIIKNVPFELWIILAFAIWAILFVIRYATNWKVDAFVLAAIVIIGTILSYRAHWIGLGYAEAQAQVKAAQLQAENYKKTEQLIENCYATTGYVWDRTQGKCLAINGAP